MAWAASLKGTALLTCSITELGFVRVTAQAPDYGFTVEQSQALLNRLKTKDKMPLAFLPDGVDISLCFEVEKSKANDRRAFAATGERQRSSSRHIGREDSWRLFDSIGGVS